MIQLGIKDETSPLEAVLLGIANSPGAVPLPADAYDPKSREFILKGEYPTEADTVKEITAFAAVLEKYGATVYRPQLLENTNQIFARDIAFVIDDSIVVANVLEDRKAEIDAIEYILDQVEQAKIIDLPETVRIEGGDVMPWNGHLFVGYSEHEDFAKYMVSRTNREGIEFLHSTFPHYELHAFELVKSDTEARYNALHLDCCFQPIGVDQAILFPEGFKNAADVDYIRTFFGMENIIEISREEMYEMNSNVFSINPKVVVSGASFTRLNAELRRRGFTVEEVPYREIGKQEGLLRCSTMPLKRK